MTAERVRPAGRKNLLALSLASLVALAILLALGTWQLQRRTWKENLIATIEARAKAAPAALAPEAKWAAWNAAEGEFRRVEARGRYLADRETLVHGLMPARRGQPLQGFYILTPLALAEGGAVIVNRGFVPTELSASGTRPKPPEGEVAVIGALRPSETRAAFVPKNEPAREEWFVRDIGEIATTRGLARIAPFLIEAEAAPEGAEWPRPVASRLNLPNNHLQYALTWFSLALVLVAVFAAFVLGQRKTQGR